MSTDGVRHIHVMDESEKYQGSHHVREDDLLSDEEAAPSVPDSHGMSGVPLNEAGSGTGTQIRIAVPDNGGAVLHHAERPRVLHVSRTPRAGRDRKAHISTL